MNWSGSGMKPVVSCIYLSGGNYEIYEKLDTAVRNSARGLSSRLLEYKLKSENS
jgi:hypothetical protein